MADLEALALKVRDCGADDLTLYSTELLRGGDARAAFMVADRLCRIAVAEPHVHLLRGEALARLGREDAAERDFRRAFEIDPTDPLVNRRRLAGGGPDALAAAATLLGDPRTDQATLAAVFRTVLDAGHDVVATLRVESGRLSGQIGFRREGPWRLDIATGQAELKVDLRAAPPDRSGFPPPIRIDVAVPAGLQSVRFVPADRPAGTVLVALRHNPHPENAVPRGPSMRGARDWLARRSGRAVTIVVPVYDDVPITRACLESVARQTAPDTAIRVIVVDDASPAEGMRPLLEGWCRDNGARLLANQRNLGFIGAVNRALEHVEGGDLLLLNSDVILPVGAVDRLMAAARLRPSIGIVNPMTNNAPFSGFPSLFEEAPLEPEERIAAIDQAAARANAGRVVGMPSAVGFCMLVTRACLDAVGGLSEVYLRGYYEDVEFCLRAAQRGFESVCAANVYVGHKGSSSFKNEKRALVMRNARVLRERFPHHEQETRAFLRADPLAPARAAIEAEIGPPEAVDVVVAGGAAYVDVLNERAATLEREGSSTVILSWTYRNGVGQASFGKPGGGLSGVGQFAATDTLPNAALIGWLDRLAPLRIELAGSGDCFAASVEAVLRSGMNFGFLVSESLGRAFPLPRSCRTPDAPDPCQECAADFDAGWQPQGVGRQFARLLQIRDLPSPSLIVSTDAMSRHVAGDLATEIFSASQFAHSEVSPSPGTAGHKPRRVLALLYRFPDAATEALLLRLARRVRAQEADIDLLVVGGGHDDRRLLACGNLFVTGPVPDRDTEEVLAQYGAAAVCAPQRWSGFGLLARCSQSMGIPKAFFDWSIGAMPAALPDLALDPRICDAKAAMLLVGWAAQALAGVP